MDYYDDGQYVEIFDRYINEPPENDDDVSDGFSENPSLTIPGHDTAISMHTQISAFSSTQAKQHPSIPASNHVGALSPSFNESGGISAPRATSSTSPSRSTFLSVELSETPANTRHYHANATQNEDESRPSQGNHHALPRVAKRQAADRLKAPSLVVKSKKPVLPQKDRTKCTECNKKFQPPKSTDTTLCSGCRKNRTFATSPAIEDTAPVDDAEKNTISLPSDFAMFAQSKVWDANITSFESATAQLLNAPRHTVQVTGDDFDQIDDAAIDLCSRKMFTAVLDAPVQAPTSFNEAKRTRFCASQLDAYAKCVNLMATEDQISDASARCRLAVEEAISLHTDGVRLNELTEESIASIRKYQASTKRSRGPARPMTRTNLLMDVDVTCKQRIEMMICAVSHNKLVAQGLLDGRKAQDLVRCPTELLKRKLNDFKTNRVKHELTKEDGDALGNTGADEAIQSQPQNMKSSKRKADESADDVPEAMKRTRLSPDALDPSSQTSSERR